MNFGWLTKGSQIPQQPTKISIAQTSPSTLCSKIESLRFSSTNPRPRQRSTIQAALKLKTSEPSLLSKRGNPEDNPSSDSQGKPFGFGKELFQVDEREMVDFAVLSRLKREVLEIDSIIEKHRRLNQAKKDFILQVQMKSR